MSRIEDLLRETLQDPRLAVQPRPDLVEAALARGHRLRQRRRLVRVGVGLVVVAAVVAATVLAPRALIAQRGAVTSGSRPSASPTLAAPTPASSGPASPPSQSPIPTTQVFDTQRSWALGMSIDGIAQGGGNAYVVGCTTCGPGSVHQQITRIDLRTGRVGPTVEVPAAARLLYAYGRLWVAIGLINPPSPSPALESLDPHALTVTQTVALPSAPTGLAAAGGLIWITRSGGLTAVDPGSATITRSVSVPLPSHSSQVARAVTGALLSVAASPDGAALWTGEGNGGSMLVQLRNPVTGQVVAATPAHDFISTAPPDFAAGDRSAWLSFATGMQSAHLRLAVGPSGTLVATTPAAWGFSNATGVALSGGLLWFVDAQTGLACADPTTGAVLARSQTPLFTGMASLAGRQFLLTTPTRVLLATPGANCSVR